MLGDIRERPRRLRGKPIVRDLVHEVDLKLGQLIQPYFVKEGKGREAIPGFTGVYRMGGDDLSRQIELDIERGLRNFLFFGEGRERDDQGSAAYDPGGMVPEALRTLRKRFGSEAVFFSDVCLCSYTSHGHCGVVNKEEILNDPSVVQLSKVALCHAEAGADFVAPSDMMDGRVAAIRRTLDQKGYTGVGILSYTAKYASSYYGPFREALSSSPQFSDRSSYQMDFRNSTEALRELRLDIAEGADMVMVKPALAYLDIISLFRRHADVPVVAYSVSGEYEMVKLLAQKGMVEERKMVIENLSAIRRAGAQVIITYYASELAAQGWIR